MLRLKTIGEARSTGARRTGNRAVTAVLAAGFLMTGAAYGQTQGTVASSTTQTTVPLSSSKIALAAPVTYDNKYEFYGAFNFMNFMAGQNLPKRMNMGGAELSFTYWLPVKNWAKNLGWVRTFVMTPERRLCLPTAELRRCPCTAPASTAGPWCRCTPVCWERSIAGRRTNMWRSTTTDILACRVVFSTTA